MLFVCLFFFFLIGVKQKRPQWLSLLTCLKLQYVVFSHFGYEWQLRYRALALLVRNLKQSEAHSAHAESKHKGVNQHSKDVTQVQQQKPVTYGNSHLAYMAYKVHKLHQSGLYLCNIFQVLINSSCIDSTCESSVFQVCKSNKKIHLEQIQVFCSKMIVRRYCDALYCEDILRCALNAVGFVIG